MDFEKIKKEFKEKKELYSNLEIEAKEILNKALTENEIKIHSLPTRVKKVESFIDKIERKQSENPFEDITDIVGLRVICLFRSDIDKISDIIRKSFDIISEENKIDEDFRHFGHMAVHFIAKLKADWKGPRYDHIKDIPFEIQVMTIAMDAWSLISHYLEYKKDEDIPKEFKKDFYALSGLLYIADSQFERFYNERRNSIEEMTKDKSYLDKEINLDSLSAYLKIKFPDRKHEKDSYSLLVQSLNFFKINKIKDLDKIIEKSYEAFLIYEKELYESDKPVMKDIGAIIIMCELMGKQLTRLPSIVNVDKYKKLIKK